MDDLKLVIEVASSFEVQGRYFNAEATSMRQSAEWGTGLLQSSFPRMKERLRFQDLGERKLIFRMYFLLVNYRSNTFGINQIRNVYMPHLNVNAHDILQSV